jgi:hypothetical protein
VIDASPAAITLVLLLTDGWTRWRRVLEVEKSRGRTTRWIRCPSPQPAARHSEPAQVFPANAAADDGRPRLDGVIAWSRSRAVGGGAADGRPSLSRFPPLEPVSGPRSTGDVADLPGGASGLLVRDYKGKEADRLVTRIDPRGGLAGSELRGHERQAAEELEQWKNRVEE